jgi:hypothetical protein
MKKNKCKWVKVGSYKDLRAGDRVRYTVSHSGDKVGYDNDPEEINRNRVVTGISKGKVEVSMVSDDGVDSRVVIRDLFYRDSQCGSQVRDVEVLRHGGCEKDKGSMGGVLEVRIGEVTDYDGNKYYQPSINVNGYKGNIFISSYTYSRNSDCKRGIERFCKALGIKYRIV